MADIEIRQAHELDQDDARRRVNELAEDLTRKLHVNCEWQGDTLLFKRPGAQGAIQLGAGFVEVKVKLGMLVKPMKDKIEVQIRDQMQRSLA